jgi:site-specific recombinase XerD
MASESRSRPMPTAQAARPRGSEPSNPRLAGRKPDRQKSQPTAPSNSGDEPRTARRAAPRVPKKRPVESTDQIDLSWLSSAERGALRRELHRLRLSRATPATASAEAGQDEGLEWVDTSYGLIASAGAARTSREDEVRYRVDPNIWDLPQFASISYDQLVSDYLGWLGTRTERGGPTSSATIKAARDTLGSFRKALIVEGEPLVASSVSARNYDAWIKHLLAADLPYAQIRLKNGRLIEHPRASRREPMSAAKIAQHTGALKAFSNLYVYKVMEYTRSDLLQRVEPYRPKPEQHRDSSRKKEVKEFSAAEVDALMSCHDTSTLLGIRDRAIAALVLATGLRVTAAAELPYAHYDPVAGVIDTVDKRRRRLAHINGTCKRAMRDWLRVRPETGSAQLFVQADGTALSKDGVRSLWRRIARKSGVRKGPHIARRTITKRALRAGEDPIRVQLMMGWASPAMVLRYADEVAQETAAAKLVDYAPI